MGMLSQTVICCRCCLVSDEETSQNFEPLFIGPHASLLRHMLLQCTGLHIEQNKGLPEKICRKCLKRLNEAFQFRHQCLENDANLRIQCPADNIVSNEIKPEIIINSNDLPESPFDWNILDDSNSFENDLPLSELKKPKVEKLDLDKKTEKNRKIKKNKIKSNNKNPVKKCKKVKTEGENVNNPIDSPVKNIIISNITDPIKDETDKCTVNYTSNAQDNTEIKDGVNDSNHLVEKKTPKSKSKGLYICDTCGHSVKVKFDLITHFRRHTGERPYKCETCGKTFAYDAGFRMHKKQHTGQKSFMCDICGKGLSTKETLLAHRRLHTGELPFKCSTCGRAFRALTNLRSHKKIHTGDKRHPCQTCNKLFYTKSDMRNHARRHTGERPFACSLCPKRFTGKSNYRLHMKIHAGQKDFQCPLCPKTFVSKDSMRRHERIHTGERSFECNECGRRFAHRSTLISHQAIHSKTKNYICDICCRRFGYPSGLYVHRKKKHNIQSSRLISNDEYYDIV